VRDREREGGVKNRERGGDDDLLGGQFCNDGLSSLVFIVCSVHWSRITLWVRMVQNPSCDL